MLITILMGVYGWMYISKMSDLQSRGKATGLPTGGTLTQVKVFYVVAVRDLFATKNEYFFFIDNNILVALHYGLYAPVVRL